MPQIAAELAVKLDAAAAAGAQLIAQSAKGRAPVATGKLREAIHVEREGVGEYAVVAGNDDVFYAHIVENGGAHTAAQPFMRPALEDSRGEIRSIATAALKRL